MTLQSKASKQTYLKHIKRLVAEITLSVFAAGRSGALKNVALWADRHRHLTKHASQYAGKWRTARFPYQRGPMEAFSNKTTRLIVMKFSTQTGKTELMLNCIGWAIDESPGPVLVVYPNETTLKKVSTTRIQPMINSCAPLVAKKHPAADKFKISEMHFSDCLIYLSSAQTPADLASMPIQYLFCDEVGKFPKFSGKEGDPVKLATERQKAFPYTSKTVLVSSPTMTDGTISQYFNNCEEQLSYFIPCPHCAKMQTLNFDNIKWDLGGLDRSDPKAWRAAAKTAQYFCGGCGAEITDSQKIKSLAKGRWLREDGTEPDADSTSIGFKLSSLYSPLLKWGTMAAEFLSVRQDPPRLMVFVNGWLCQEWMDATIEKKDPTTVLESNKFDFPPRVVPEGTLVLTMGIDSQANGFYFVVRAWQQDRTSILIDSGFLPSLENVRSLVFDQAYPINGEPGASMRIWRAAIDTGGTRLDQGPSMTEQIYQWLRKIPVGVVAGIKGGSWPSGQRVKRTVIDRMPGKHGVPMPGGIVLYLLDTGKFKDALHYLLSIPVDAPGAFRFHNKTDNMFMRQLLSEYKSKDTKTGKERWVPIRGRENHYLDCEVYSMACADVEWDRGLSDLIKPVGIIRQSQPTRQSRKKRGQMVVNGRW